MRAVRLGPVSVGDDFPTVFVAETGSFFNQDIAAALNYVDQVAASGADIFKTEIIHDANICLGDTGTMVTYRHATGSRTEVYREHVDRKRLSLDNYGRILTHARDRGIPFIATIFDFAGVDFLVAAGGCGIKISRNNINNVPLIRYAAKAGLPLIFDEGHVYLDELATALRCARTAGCEEIIVNYHPGFNPAGAEQHNLRVIETYKKTFGVPVGLACHYRGDEILYTAVGAGVNLIEKGVDADPDREEADLVSAVSLRQLPEVVAKVRACWQALGVSRPIPPEPRDLSARCGIVAARPLPVGTILRQEDLRFAWPCVGVSVGAWDRVVGATLDVAVASDQPISWQDLRFSLPES